MAGCAGGGCCIAFWLALRGSMELIFSYLEIHIPHELLTDNDVKRHAVHCVMFNRLINFLLRT